MGVKKDRASIEAPWWVIFILAGGLLCLLGSTRIVAHKVTLAKVFAGLGFVTVLAATAWRAAAWATATGGRKKVERIFFLGYAGVLAALVLWGLAGTEALSWLSISISDPKSKDKFETAIGVIAPILLAVSLLPTLFATFSDLGDRRASGDAYVDAQRISEAATGGLTVALAGAMLFMACYIASERDKKVDLSYFRTSAPGSATINMMSSQDAPLKVLLFFPAVNEVKNEVESYFRDVADRTGRVEVETHDRYVSAKLAKDYKVSKDGVVVFVKGERSETITIGTEMQEAKTKLRGLDEEVQKAFMKLARSARTAYLTVGHGELNDPAEDNATQPPGLRSATAIKQLLGILNYKVKDFGLPQGSSTDVPDDAGVVLMLGPKKAFLPQELEALDRYLERGGAIIMALDPGGEFQMGPLEARLGVKFDPTPISDDKQFYPVRKEKSDHRWIVTDQFSAHASVTTLSRSRVLSGILLINPGSLSDAGPAGDKNAPKKTFVIRTRATSFSDSTDNFEFDSATEKRQSHNVVAVIEGAAPPAEPDEAPEDPAADPKKPKKKKEKPKAMRAVVFADAELMGDFLIFQSALNAALVQDTFKWAGGEEEFIGETISEKDIDIHQTKGEDQVYYYLTVAGAPLVILGLGLSFVFMRRNRPRRGVPAPRPAPAKKAAAAEGQDDEAKKSEEKKS